MVRSHEADRGKRRISRVRLRRERCRLESTGSNPDSKYLVGMDTFCPDRRRGRPLDTRMSATLDGTLVQPCYSLSVMKRHAFRNRRTRLRLTLLLMLSLLFQQFALAAYVCPVLGAPAVNAAVRMHCDDTSAPQQRDGSPLCDQSCAQQPLTAQHAQLPDIPPSSIPAWLPSSLLAVVPRTSGTPFWSETAAPDTGTPPVLRFRVLLI